MNNWSSLLARETVQVETYISSGDDAVQCTVCQAHFKCRATSVSNSIDRIKFDFSTAVVQRLKPSRATAV